jgi:hypothetical protein
VVAGNLALISPVPKLVTVLQTWERMCHLARLFGKLYCFKTLDAHDSRFWPYILQIMPTLSRVSYPETYEVAAAVATWGSFLGVGGRLNNATSPRIATTPRVKQ